MGSVHMEEGGGLVGTEACARVSKLLHEGLDPNKLLRVAAAQGQPSVVSLLIDSGADVNLAGPWGPPLFIAVARENIGTVRALLEAGASPDACKDHRTALYMAAFTGRLDTVSALVSAGCAVNGISGQLHPLRTAVNQRFLPIVVYLLSQPGIHMLDCDDDGLINGCGVDLLRVWQKEPSPRQRAAYGLLPTCRAILGSPGYAGRRGNPFDALPVELITMILSYSCLPVSATYLLPSGTFEAGPFPLTFFGTAHLRVVLEHAMASPLASLHQESTRTAFDNALLRVSELGGGALSHLDAALCDRFDLSMLSAKRAVKWGCVSVNGRVCKVRSRIVREHDKVALTIRCDD